MQTLFEFGAKYGPAIGAGQWWRLVTAGFLHGGILHILMNSWVLFDLGAQVEELYGGARMLVIYFVANVVGFYFSALWRPETPSVGASAALFGMVGAMLALASGIKAADGRYGSQRLRPLSRVPAALQPHAGVDMAAHIGGLVGGFGLAICRGTAGHRALAGGTGVADRCGTGRRGNSV